MDDSETYYQILGIPESASQKEIRSRWAKLVQDYHSDKFQKVSSEIPQWMKDEAERRLKDVNEAWEVLKDPEKRMQYDQGLKAIRQDYADTYDADTVGAAPTNQPYAPSSSAATPPPSSGQPAAGSPPRTTPSASASSSVPSVHPTPVAQKTGGSGVAGCLVLVVVVVLLFAALGAWLKTYNGTSNGAKIAPGTPNDSGSQAGGSTPTQPSVPYGVRIRRITGIIYSYPEKRWGGNLWGMPGDSFPEIDLRFWSGLVAGSGDLHWKGSYRFEGNNLCLAISGLQVSNQSAILGNYYSDVGVGYGVELENGTFGDFTMSRALILYRTFPGDTPPQEITKCFAVLPVAPSETEAYRMGGQWEGSGGDVNLTMRISQKGNRFAGSMIATQKSGNGQPEKIKVGIEGYVLNDRVTFDRRDKNELIYISYVAPFSKGNPQISGTWYLGLEKGTWQMTRTGDIQGGLDDYASPDFSNPPSTNEKPLSSDVGRSNGSVMTTEAPRMVSSEPPARPSAPSPSAQDLGQITISSPAEFNAYQYASTLTDPAAKAAALENFLQTYPQSNVKKIVLRQLIDSYKQSNQADMVRDAASRLQQLDSK
jgi:hypothetical protein